MNTYKFYQDIKVSVWQRQHFEIEAESEEEAKRIAMKFRNRDVSDEEEYSYAETLHDTEEFMTVEENDGNDTIQLYLRGEKYPFVTNGWYNPGRFDEFKDVKQVVYRDMASHVVETTDCWEGTEYSAFHADGRLNIVIMRRDETADKFVFDESWHDLVNNNEDFRRKMAGYLIERNRQDAPFVHDWLAGHLTGMKATSVHVDDKVPFDLHEILEVWKDHAEKKTYKPAALIGYQVFADEEDCLPEGLAANDIIRDRQDAMAWLRKARDEAPERNYDIYPVYEGEVQEPVFK